jgi:hypothetical protein
LDGLCHGLLGSAAAYVGGECQACVSVC